MYELLKGDQENLEGKAIVFAVNEKGEPFKNNGQIFFPSLYIKVVDIKGITAGMDKQIGFLPPNFLEKYPELEGDVLKTKNLCSKPQGEIKKGIFFANKTLEAIAILYSETYVNQQLLFDFEEEGYTKPKSDNQEQDYVSRLLAISKALLNTLVKKQSPNKLLKDLESLTRDRQDLIPSVKEIFALVCLTKKSDNPIQLLETTLLSVKKFECIVQENYKMAAELRDQIKQRIE